MSKDLGALHMKTYLVFVIYLFFVIYLIDKIWVFYNSGDVPACTSIYISS